MLKNVDGLVYMPVPTDSKVKVQQVISRMIWHTKWFMNVFMTTARNRKNYEKTQKIKTSLVFRWWSGLRRTTRGRAHSSAAIASEPHGAWIECAVVGAWWLPSRELPGSQGRKPATKAVVMGAWCHGWGPGGVVGNLWLIAMVYVVAYVCSIGGYEQKERI